MVLHNAVITRIANLKPETKQDLIHIKGLGDAKIEKIRRWNLETIKNMAEESKFNSYKNRVKIFYI